MTEIDDKYAQLGGPNGFLGASTTAEQICSDGIGHFRRFQNGSIYWHPRFRTHEVHGEIHGLWQSLGWERSSFGYPLTDELDTHHHRGRYNEFQDGFIYWEPGRRAYEVFRIPRRGPCAPSTVGNWEIPPFTSGVVGIHAALLHTNKILFFTYREPPHPETAHEAPQPHGDSAVLNLATGTVTRPTPSERELNLFCSGHAFLPDGRLLIGGGEREHPGVRSIHIFNPANETWQYVGNMQRGRWYPTCVTLPNGQIFIVGGLAWETSTSSPPNSTYDIFGNNTIQAGLPVPLFFPVPGQSGEFVTYPFVFVLPTGKLFIHDGIRTMLFDLATWSIPTFTEAAIRPGRNARTYSLEGTSVLLPLSPNTDPPYRARVMIMGGGGAPPINMRSPATETCEILDTSSPTSEMRWELVAPMSRPRVMPDSVLLPDGNVLVMNGSSTGYADNGANPVFDVQMYNPLLNRWTTLCSMTIPRLYHATAILLPDGRVMTAGTDVMWNPDPFHESQLRLEFYSPPYLFRGQRPIISEAPAEIFYRKEFVISTPDAENIYLVCLIRSGSVTHSFNSDQRHVELRVSAAGKSSLKVISPPNGCVAPPGYYLLFIVTKDGIPSIGKFVLMRSEPTFQIGDVMPEDFKKVDPLKDPVKYGDMVFQLLLKRLAIKTVEG